MEKIAYLAGGCFWCISPIFKIHKANKVIAGYSGGDEINPSYELVKAQKTNHRETIAVYYDDEILSYEKIIQIFLSNVDPFDKDGQYIDKGHSYTLAIYYTNDKEKDIAISLINKLKEESKKDVYISIEPFKSFYKALDYHQDYYLKNPKEFNKELYESGRKKIVLETERLILREYRNEDINDLYEIIGNKENMSFYPKPYSYNDTQRWIDWNLNNYKKYGFGLYALELKENGKFIGDTGLTMQNIDNEELPEIGYHIHKDYWRQGYGKEAALAVRDYIFKNFNFKTLYSYMKYDNVASYSLAKSIGMEKLKEYEDKEDKVTLVYCLSKDKWLTLID